MKFHKVGKSSRTYVLEYEKASSLLHKRMIIPKKEKKMDGTQWKTKITVSHGNFSQNNPLVDNIAILLTQTQTFSTDQSQESYNKQKHEKVE